MKWIIEGRRHFRRVFIVVVYAALDDKSREQWNFAQDALVNKEVEKLVIRTVP